MPDAKTKTPAPAPSPALEVADVWGRDLLHNLGPVISTEAYNHLHAAIGDLTKRLAALTKEA